MKLIDLNPKWNKGGLLAFDCPLCSKGGRDRDASHRVRIDARWKCRGNFENLRVYPKIIQSNCGHVFGIECGEIIDIEKRKLDKNLVAL